MIMKYFTKIMVVFFVLICSNVFIIVASAKEKDYYTEVSETQANEYIKNYEFALLNVEPEKSDVQCFAVSEKGDLAVLCGKAGKGYKASIYSSSGDFKCGYTFVTSGSAHLEYVDGFLNICITRSNIVITVDDSGNILKVAVTDLWTDEMYHLPKYVNGTTYDCTNEKRIFNLLFKHSQIVATDSNGESTIIYDATDAVTRIAVKECIGAALFITIWIIMFCKMLLPLMKKEDA